MPTTATVQSRIAGLAENTTTLSGVAIAAGDVTKGLSGDLKVWTADELQAAAGTLDGQAANLLHSEQTLDNPVRAGWDPEREAVVYEVEITDAKLAEQAEQGVLAVSIEARHADGGTRETPRGEAMLATDIRFTGLSIDRTGAAPSQTVDVGESQALAAELTPADIHATLTAPDATLATVAGVTFDDTAEGDLDESAIDADETDLSDHYLYGSGDDKEDYSYPVVDADGTLRRGNVDAAWQLGCRGQCDGAEAHRERLLDLAAAFDDPPDWAADADAAMAAETDDPVSPESGPGEAPDSTSDEPAESGTDPMTAMSDDTPEDEPDHEERLNELKADLNDARERIAELEAEKEQLAEQRADVARAYAEALADEDDLVPPAELTEKYTVSELREKFEAAEAALAQSTDPEPDVQSGAGEGTESAALSEAGESLVAELGVSDRDEAVAMLEDRLAKYENRGWDGNAQTARERLATLGVEVES